MDNFYKDTENSWIEKIIILSRINFIMWFVLDFSLLKNAIQPSIEQFIKLNKNNNYTDSYDIIPNVA